MITRGRHRPIGFMAVILGVVACFAYVQANVIGVPSGVYGDVLSQNENAIKGAVVEDVAIYPRKMANSQERIMRKAVLVRRKRAKATVLLSHGFMCDKMDIAFLRSLFSRYNTMIFDMRAHGEHTEGQYCTFGRDEALDVATAAKFLRTHPDLKGKPLLVYGFSMGAVAAIEAQAKDSSLFISPSSVRRFSNSTTSPSFILSRPYLSTMASTAASSPPVNNRSRSPMPFERAFSRADEVAIESVSNANRPAGPSFAAASARIPVPVPISRMRAPLFSVGTSSSIQSRARCVEGCPPVPNA